MLYDVHFQRICKLYKSSAGSTTIKLRIQLNVRYCKLVRDKRGVSCYNLSRLHLVVRGNMR